MKKLLLAVVALFAATSFLFNAPALAGDAAAGKAIFNAKCVACHIGGGNAVNPTKTLKKADLEKYGKNSVDAIVAQVTNGNGAMPAFRGQISPADIENVATYILSQAEKGW